MNLNANNATTKQKFQSNINREYIFNLLQKYIEKDNLSISQDKRVAIFDSVYSELCTSCQDTSLLIDVNRELINQCYSQYKTSQETVSKPNVSIKQRKTKFLHSADRTKGTRYNYTINLEQPMKKLVKLHIPIEDNFLFVTTLFQLTIPELDIDTNCECKQTIQMNNYMIGIYEPEQKDIQLNYTGEIHITLHSLFIQDKLPEDVYKLDSLKNNTIQVNDPSQFKLNDIIKIKETRHTFSIQSIQETSITIINSQNIMIQPEHTFLNYNLQHIVEYTE